MHRSNKTKTKDYSDKFKSKINNLKRNNFFKKYKNVKLLKNIAIIIPARIGSKRLKNKNIFKFKNKPMIFWAINAAKNIFLKSNTYVSSDSSKILKIAKTYGVKTIKRPKDLAKDKTFKIDVIRHAVNVIERKIKRKLNLIISLQANSPEVMPEDIENTLIHLVKYKRQEVISIDSNNNANAAIRTMKREAVFQKSLSTHLGCVETDISDIHTLNDINKIYKKNGTK